MTELQDIANDKLINELIDQHTNPEPLHPDLAAHLEHTELFGTSLRHPLVYSIIHTPGMNALVNKQYAHKRAALTKAELDADWLTYVFLHERPYRLDALIDLDNRHGITGEDYWPLVGRIWTDSENIWQNYCAWQEVLTDSRNDRQLIMDDTDQQVYNELPETFTIHRGYNHDDLDWQLGMSWTLDQRRAHWFAKRYPQKGKSIVATGTAKREDVIAYFGSRNEQEIVIMPDDLLDITFTEVI